MASESTMGSSVHLGRLIRKTKSVWCRRTVRVVLPPALERKGYLDMLIAFAIKMGGNCQR